MEMGKNTMSDEEIAREAATKMLKNFSGLTFDRSFAEMSEQIILAAIKKAKEEDEEIDGGSRPL